MGGWFRSLVCVKNKNYAEGVRGYYTGITRGKTVNGVKNIIAVASGKDGVGKSTTAVNLAVALAKKCRLKVGLIDADISKPNIPTIMQGHGHLEMTEDSKMVPFENHGIKCISVGCLFSKDRGLELNGKMALRAVVTLAEEVDWGDLDFLVVDMPRGTGDAQNYIAYGLKFSGALIVSTPKDVKLYDAQRGADTFSKYGVPILGVLQNMSCLKCPRCGVPAYVFLKKETSYLAPRMKLEIISEVPLDREIRRCLNEGTPIVISDPDSTVSKSYGDLAEDIVSKLEELSFLG